MEEEKDSLAEKLRDSVVPRGPKSIAEPEKELRFTRAAQAPLFFALSVIFFAAFVAVLILSTQVWGMGEPLWVGCWWLCVPLLLFCYGLLRVGLRCVRHAYIILSPLGVEIFPFFRAKENLQVIYWSQVADVELREGARQLVLHFSEEKKSGVVASLRPIPASRRHLLEEAVLGILEKREEG